MKEKKRLVLVDYLKALCVVFVIITHGDFSNDAMLDKNGLWYLLAVNKAVPVFMFLSGYVFSLGAKKSLHEQYNIKRLTGKFLRLFVPTLIAFIGFVGLKALSADGITIGEIIRRIVTSDFGRGSYYFPIMVQFILLAPLMHHVIDRFREKGVVLIGAVNLLYEAVWTFLSPPAGLFRILFLRYLLVSAFGMYMAQRRPGRIKWSTSAIFGVIGLIYILLPYFTDYKYKIFTVSPWNKSGMMTAFYVVCVMSVVFFLWEKAEEKGVISRTVAYIGQASYHIMYTQMLYFVVRPAFDKAVFDITTLPLFVQFIVDIVVSVVSGMVFCMLDNKFLGKFYRIK